MPLACGLLVFGVAVFLDLGDRERVTVWSDCAFWLHVVSAPLLVHPLFILATGQDVVFGRIEPGTSATVMLGVLIAVFVYVALAIDRRSLLIPTLAYFGSLGIYYLINGAANQTGVPPFALILLVVGALIMVFGAGWQRIRALIVRPNVPHIGSRQTSPHQGLDTHDHFFSPRNGVRTRPPYHWPEGRQARCCHCPAQPLAAPAARR